MKKSNAGGDAKINRVRRKKLFLFLLYILIGFISWILVKYLLESLKIHDPSIIIGPLIYIGATVLIIREVKVTDKLHIKIFSSTFLVYLLFGFNYFAIFLNHIGIKIVKEQLYLVGDSMIFAGNVVLGSLFVRHVKEKGVPPFSLSLFYFIIILFIVTWIGGLINNIVILDELFGRVLETYKIILGGSIIVYGLCKITSSYIKNKL